MNCSYNINDIYNKIFNRILELDNTYIPSKYALYDDDYFLIDWLGKGNKILAKRIEYRPYVRKILIDGFELKDFLTPRNNFEVALTKKEKNLDLKRDDLFRYFGYENLTLNHLFNYFS